MIVLRFILTPILTAAFVLASLNGILAILIFAGVLKAAELVNLAVGVNPYAEKDNHESTGRTL